MASSELKGVIKRIGATEVVSEKFKKREIVLTIDTETQYPQPILIEAAQDKCDDATLNQAKEGDEVTVSFNFRGRGWDDPKKGREVIFNTLQYWKMTINNAATSTANQAQTQDDPSGGLPF